MKIEHPKAEKIFIVIAILLKIKLKRVQNEPTDYIDRLCITYSKIDKDKDEDIRSSYFCLIPLNHQSLSHNQKTTPLKIYLSNFVYKAKWLKIDAKHLIL